MKVGDTITITLDDIPEYYMIVGLTENMMFAKADLDSAVSIILKRSGNEWKIPFYKKPYKIELYKAKTFKDLFTYGNKDLARTVLLNLPEEDLENMCSAGTYRDANIICNEDFYRLRLEKFFPGAEQFKSKDMTYKDFYLILYDIIYRTDATYRRLFKDVEELDIDGDYNGDYFIREILRHYAQQDNFNVVKYMYELGKVFGKDYVPSYVSTPLSPEMLEWLLDRDAEFPHLKQSGEVVSELLAHDLLGMVSRSRKGREENIKLLNILFDKGFYPGSSRISNILRVTRNDSEVNKWITSHFDAQGNPKK